MRRVFIAGLSAVSLVTTTGCTTDGQLTPGGGMAIGCIGGALIVKALTNDSRKAVAGCVAGGIAMMLALNEAEKKKKEEAEERALDYNQRVDWRATQVATPGTTEPIRGGAPAPRTEYAPTQKTYSERNPRYCRTHRTACRRKDERELQLARSDAPRAKSAPAKPQPRPAEAVTATGWIIPVSTRTNAQGQTCHDLKEHAEKNGKMADETKAMCKTSTGWVVEV